MSVTFNNFLGRLARHANAVLAASKDNNLRFLWIDDIVSPKILPVPSDASLETTAYVSENGGRSFVCYRVTLQLGRTSAARLDSWSALLPKPDSTDWLQISRANKEIVIDLRSPTN
jgi:hypothetical protein